MATYEEIYGKRVKEFDSDPTLESSYEGQVWYDKSTGTLKSVVTFDSFTSASPITTTRSNIAGMGTQTAALAAAGSVPPYSAACELYNGTGWTNTTSNNTARQTASSSGTSTAGLIAGGQSAPGQPGYTNASEEFDGSSWTEGNNLNMTRAGLCGFGTQTAGVAAGGYGPPPSGTHQNATEEYDGTSWTAQNTFTTGAEALAGAGTQTAGLVFGGASPSNTTRTAEYDGTNWTAGGALNTARHALAGDGIQTSAIAIGGNTGSYSGAAEKYDGTSWTTSPATLGTSRAHLAASHTSSNNSTAVVFGGQTPSVTTATEEFTNSTNTITPAAFSTGGTLGTNRGAMSGGSGAGIQTAAVIACGYVSPNSVTSNVEEYDGTSWTEVTNYPSGMQWLMGVGTQTAGLFFGGQNNTNSNGGTNQTLTVEYDGTSWTTSGGLNAARRVMTGFGTQTAAVGANGNPSSNQAEAYDGSSWTNLPTPGNSCEGRGSAAASPQTAGLIFGGSSPPDGKQVEEWNGSSWSEQNNLINDRRYLSGFGIQTDALGCAGYDQEATTNRSDSVRYNGTTWATDANTPGSYSQQGNAAAAPSTAGLQVTGTTTVEYNAATSVITAKTLTSS